MLHGCGSCCGAHVGGCAVQRFDDPGVAERRGEATWGHSSTRGQSIQEALTQSIHLQSVPFGYFKLKVPLGVDSNGPDGPAVNCV